MKRAALARRATADGANGPAEAVRRCARRANSYMDAENWPAAESRSQMPSPGVMRLPPRRCSQKKACGAEIRAPTTQRVHYRPRNGNGKGAIRRILPMALTLSAQSVEPVEKRFQLFDDTCLHLRIGALWGEAARLLGHKPRNLGAVFCHFPLDKRTRHKLTRSGVIQRFISDDGRQRRDYRQL